MLCVRCPSIKTSITKITCVSPATINALIERHRKTTHVLLLSSVFLLPLDSVKSLRHCLHFSILVAHRSAFGVTWELVSNCTLRSPRPTGSGWPSVRPSGDVHPSVLDESVLEGACPVLLVALYSCCVSCCVSYH